jgi:hypothetical protein
MWPGNTGDVTTLIAMIDRLRRRFYIARVCVVADRARSAPRPWRKALVGTTGFRRYLKTFSDRSRQDRGAVPEMMLSFHLEAA